jgi:hypothetical protein
MPIMMYRNNFQEQGWQTKVLRVSPKRVARQHMTKCNLLYIKCGQEAILSVHRFKGLQSEHITARYFSKLAWNIEISGPNENMEIDNTSKFPTSI